MHHASFCFFLPQTDPSDQMHLFGSSPGLVVENQEYNHQLA